MTQLVPCAAKLEAAKTAVTWAYVTFLTAIPLVGIAIALNAGFFTAPFSVGLMLGAWLACTAAASKLGEAAILLRDFKDCGGLAQDCHDEASYVEDMINRATVSAWTAAGICFAVAAFAWIPWVAGIAMIAVLISLGVTGAFLLSLNEIWSPLTDCQDQVARSRGALEAGEKAGDPWFLRLRPLDGLPYARPVDSSTAVVQKDVVNDVWLRLSLMSAGEWEIRAIANIVGSKSARVSFAWTLDGKALGPGSATSDGRESTLVYRTPASEKEEVVLRVEARDATGFSRTKEVTFAIQGEYLDGRMYVAIPQLEFRSPILTVSRNRLQPAVDAFYGSLAAIARGSRTSPR